MSPFCLIPYSPFSPPPLPPHCVYYHSFSGISGFMGFFLFQELSSFDVKGGANPPRTAQIWMTSSSKSWLMDIPWKICEKVILCLSLSVSLYQYFFPHGMWLFLWGSLRLSLSPWVTSKVLTVVIVSPKFSCLMGSSRQDTQHQELSCNSWTGEKVTLLGHQGWLTCPLTRGWQVLLQLRCICVHELLYPGTAGLSQVRGGTHLCEAP